MSRTGIAGTLKMKRKELGLSIDTVCKQLEKYDISLSKNSMYNYESGYRQPDADTLIFLLAVPFRLQHLFQCRPELRLREYPPPLI